MSAEKPELRELLKECRPFVLNASCIVGSPSIQRLLDRIDKV